MHNELWIIYWSISVNLLFLQLLTLKRKPYRFPCLPNRQAFLFNGRCIMKKLQKFETIMDGLARRHGVHSVFSDFLTLLICAFSHGRMEEEYFRTIRKYEKPEAYTISEALAALVIETNAAKASLMVYASGFSYFRIVLKYSSSIRP